MGSTPTGRPGARAPDLIQKSRARALGLAAALVLLSLGTAQASPASSAPLPWAVGDQVTGAGTCDRIQRHPEYLRTSWRQGDRVHRVEIVPLTDPKDPWAAGPYRVQPAPGGQASEGALRALQADLIMRSQAPDHAPFVGKASRVTTPEDALETPSSRGDNPYPPAGAPWLLLLVVAGLVCSVVALARHLAGSNVEGRILLGGVAAGLLGALGVALGLDPSGLDPAWISILHEGNTEHVVRALWGSGHHGPLRDALRWALTEGGGHGEVLPIRVIVVMNLALATLNGVVLLTAGRLITGRWLLSVVTAAAVVVSPLFVNAATSELPAQLIFTLCLAAAGAVAALPSQRLLGLASLALLTICLGLTRAEWTLAGAMVMGTGALATLPVHRLPDGGWRTPAAALALAALLWWSVPLLLTGERATYLGVGITPWDPAPAVLPLALCVGLGLGAVVLAVLGCVDLLGRRLWIGAPLALVVLTRMYGEASHRGEAPYEVLRYATLLLPGIALAAMVGWRTLLDGSIPQLAPRARLGIAIALGLLHFAPLGELIAVPLFPHHHQATSPLYEAPLDRDQQREARALIALAEERSPCVAVAVSARDPKPTDPIVGWDYVFFGGPVATPLSVERDVDRLGAHVANLGSEGCVRFVSGLDCHVEGYAGCAAERAKGVPDPTVDAGRRPYYDHLVREATAEIQVFRW